MNGDANTLRIAVDVPLLRVLYVLTNAVDNNAFGYWVRRGSVEAHLPEGFRVADVAWLTDDERNFWGDSAWYFAALIPGGRLTFAEATCDNEACEGPCVHDTTRVLDLAAVERGLTLMAKHSPRHFADLVGENDDVETADVLVQLCVLGEVRYG